MCIRDSRCSAPTLIVDNTNRITHLVNTVDKTFQLNLCPVVTQRKQTVNLPFRFNISERRQFTVTFLSLIHILQDKELHQAYKETLKAFYGVLKSADQYLKFYLLTSVTKFGQVSVFKAT